MKNTRITLNVSEELKESLEAEAKSQGRSLSNYILIKLGSAVRSEDGVFGDKPGQKVVLVTPSGTADTGTWGPKLEGELTGPPAGATEPLPTPKKPSVFDSLPTQAESKAARRHG